MSGELTVVRYDSGERQAWDSFVTGSKNGTFLHCRGYVEYHSDRFDDCSLMLCDSEGRLLALLPAERAGTLVRSHGGLTYGAFVVDDRMTAGRMLDALSAVARHLVDAGVTRLLYKTVPHIYHRKPAEEDLYALFRAGARLVRRDVLTVIAAGRRSPLQERRARSLRKARGQGIEVRETTDYHTFWEILAANLASRHGVPPVHREDEIELLAARFPTQIRLHAAYRDGEMLAGALVYVSSEVCHVQYNAAAPEGRSCGALDLVLESVIAEYETETRFFDFGASTEEDGRVLNAGLVEYKEGFGARTVVHDAYELELEPAALASTRN